MVEEGVKLDSVIDYLKRQRVKEITAFWNGMKEEERRRLKSLVYGDEKLSDTFDTEFQKFLDCTNNSWSSSADANQKFQYFGTAIQIKGI